MIHLFIISAILLTGSIAIYYFFVIKPVKQEKYKTDWKYDIRNF